MSVIEEKMYALAIIGLLTTVISAFYYLKIIKTIYFDENKLSFDVVKIFFCKHNFFKLLIINNFFPLSINIK